MKFPAFPLHPAQDVNHPFVQGIPPIRHLVAQVADPGITVLVSKGPSFYSIMAPKRRRSDPGRSDLPKRSHEVVSFSEEVKVLNKERKKKIRG